YGKKLATAQNRSIARAMGQPAILAGVLTPYGISAHSRGRRRIQRLPETDIPGCHAAIQRSRFTRMFSITIRAAGVTISVSTVAKPRPKTMAVERWIHHCVAGAPTETSRERNSTLTPKAIGSTPRIAVN